MQTVKGSSGANVTESEQARAHWLATHDVHTLFLDAGFGCCWFAQKGDEEPVTGDTEEEAIARLVRGDARALSHES
jgi:hypothetical protein